VKLSNAAVSTQGITYDTGSIMHYSAYAFSRNGKPTIVAHRGVSANRMGQRVRFTSQDVQHINALYCDPSEHKPAYQEHIVYFIALWIFNTGVLAILGMQVTFKTIVMAISSTVGTDIKLSTVAGQS